MSLHSLIHNESTNKKSPPQAGWGFYTRAYTLGNADQIAGSDLIWFFIHSVDGILLKYIKKAM